MTDASATDFNDYTRLTYGKYQERAKNNNLSEFEKVGFPDEYRNDNQEDYIFEDIYQKLDLARENITVVDIGCGCSSLAKKIIANAKEKNQKLILIDSVEMLDLIEDDEHIIKVEGIFPDNFDQLKDYIGKADVVLNYSVLATVYFEWNPFNFVDKCLELIRVQGKVLVADIPNLSKRNRFFQSEVGQKYHQEYCRAKNLSLPTPVIKFPDIYESIDDSVIISLLTRYRACGFETYLLPQDPRLNFHARREDVLIVRT